MINRLKRRMILVVLAGLLLASAGVVIAINWMNWNSLQAQAEEVLDMLAENNGQRPIFLMDEQDMDRKDWEMPPFIQQDGRTPAPMGTDFAWLSGREKMFNGRGRSKALINAANLTNYYTAELDADGGVLSWSSDRTDLYTDEEIAQMAKSALETGRDSGKIGTCFFRLLDKAEEESACEKQLIVVDSRLEIQNAESVLRQTILVAVIEDALLSLAAILLIHKLVKPVDEAMEKQKQFVWDASHELKTPLAVISANAEALEAETGESKPLEYIRSEVDRTDKLIQSLLTLARMEKGTAQAQHAPFDLSRAVMEVALPFESAVFEAGKTMDIQVPDGIQYTGDAEMIKQLMVVLLSNAQKYSDDGGKITVSLEAKGEKRLLRVHNTGPAIPAEAQQRIFDRFYRADSSHNREIEGNGLGLAIAQNIVNAHKGKIAVRSQEGEGTTFTVTL
ncbi:MAG: HAMP domain-containing histidine kinase [Clostridia bacterium]|nr:HAMP domain-containing histidine kinase [Clostridia bacterium]